MRAIFLMCAGAAAAGATAATGAPAGTGAPGDVARPETFVIHAGEGGREATIKIPASAVADCSANSAEALVDADPQVEAMRLRGSVRIGVIGAEQPIEIQADIVVLELTADETPGMETRGVPAAPVGVPAVPVTASSRPARVIIVQTAAGAMQITADRVEHTAGAAAKI